MAILGINEHTLFPEDEVSYNESSLSSSLIFNQFNKSSGNVVDKAKTVIKNGRIIANEDIQTQYMRLKQYGNSFTKAAVVAFDQGLLNIVYNNNPENNISMAFPFLTFKKGDNYVTYIFINPYASINKDDQIIVNETALNILMQSAYAANRIKTNPDKVYANSYIETITLEIYVKLIMRILLREYGFGSEKELVDIVQYFISRFYLEKVFESRDGKENIEKLSSDHFRYVDDMKYNEIKDLYDKSNVDSFEKLLDLIKGLSGRMDTLNLKMFVDKFMQVYYMPSLMAIDNFEYLIFVIISLLNGAGNIINIKAKDIVTETKNIKMFNQELLKLI